MQLSPKLEDKLRELIEQKIDKASEALNDSTEWWDDFYCDPTVGEILINDMVNLFCRFHELLLKKAKT